MTARLGRLLRGWRSRLGTLLVLGALTGVVTAGTIAVLRFADAAGDAAATSPALALPLLIIGVAAIPACGAELARARRQELAVARLRGLHGPRLLLLILAEPLVAILLGAAVGVAGGHLAGEYAVHRWLIDPGTGTDFGTGTGFATGTGSTSRPDSTTGAGSLAALASGSGLSAVAVAVGVVLLALAAVCLAGVLSRRVPLADQVATHSRPARAGLAGRFAAVGILVAAATAVYRARQQDPSDWVVFAGPALVGLALGQIAVWAVHVLARVLASRTRGTGLPGFLASRRLARSGDAATGLRLMVAAGVVATLGASAAAAVTDWSQDTSTLQAGTQVSYEFADLTGPELLDTARGADPQGRWLMPAVLVPGSVVADRRAFVDAASYERVLGDTLSDTGAAGAGDRIGRLIDDTAPPTGDRVVFSASVPNVRTMDVDITLSYVAVDGTAGETRVTRRLRPGQELRFTRTLKECASGCLPLELEVYGLEFPPANEPGQNQPGGDTGVPLPPPGPVPPLRVTEFRLGDTDLTRLDWSNRNEDLAVLAETGEARLRGGIWVLTLPEYRGDRLDPLQLEVVPPSLPVLATTASAGEVEVTESPGGNARTADIVGTVPDLPLVGHRGVLADLPTALRGSSRLVASAQRLVLVRDGAPAEVVAALEEAGGTRRTREGVRDALEGASGGAGVKVFRALALACLAVALLTLLGGLGRQRRGYAADAAALRVIGVPAGTLRAAGRLELLLLAGVAALAVAAGGWLAVRTVLPSLPTATPPAWAAPLDLSPRWAGVATIVLLLAGAVALAGRAARRLDPARTRPETVVRGAAG